MRWLLLAACTVIGLALVGVGVAQVLAPKTLPVRAQVWPEPSEEEIEEAEEIRQYPPEEDAVLTVTAKAIGVYDAPVVDSSSDEDLDKGVIHLPETPMPWEEREQKNVYLAGHRVGRPDTTGRMIFFNLDKLESGDLILVKDTSGNEYGYEVSEVFVVEPDAEWAIDPMRGRDMLTLQTCTYPDAENRIIVRADRV